MNKIVVVLMFLNMKREKKKIYLVFIYCKFDIFNENVNVLLEFELFK